MTVSRRGFAHWRVAAAALLAAAAGGYRRFSGPWYPPTPYDDLLHQIVDRGPAAMLGNVAEGDAAISMRKLAARLRQPGFAWRRGRAAMPRPGRRGGSRRLGRAGKRRALRHGGGERLSGSSPVIRPRSELPKKTSPSRSASVSTASAHSPLSSSSARKMPGSKPEESGGVEQLRRRGGQRCCCARLR